MKKILNVFLLSIIGFVLFPYQGEVAYPMDGTTPAGRGYDPVQRCLDQVQLKLAGKTAPVAPVTSHPVRNPPEDLPIQCLDGTLDEIRSAFRNQIAYCKSKTAEEKAQTF